MNPVIVDTNVLCVANGLTPQASPACVDNCVDLLVEIMTAGHLLLDEYEIFEEYRHLNTPTDKGGVGNSFLLWALRHQGTARCTQVVTTPHPERGYEEFPAHPALTTFDRSDRKFVAVALAHAGAGHPMPVIHNATDSDWAKTDHYAAFLAHGLRIDFVCPDHVAAPS